VRARRRIEGASFPPDLVKVLGQAFDEAWKSIEGNFGGDQRAIEDARLLLADAVLSVANDSSRDVETVKLAALQLVRDELKRRA